MINLNDGITIRHNIKGFISASRAEFDFPARIELYRQVAEWKYGARTTFLNTKHVSLDRALARFKRSGVKEFFLSCRTQSEWYSDDSIEIFYKE